MVILLKVSVFIFLLLLQYLLYAMHHVSLSLGFKFCQSHGRRENYLSMQLLIIVQMINSPPLKESECSLPCSQEPILWITY